MTLFMREMTTHDYILSLVIKIVEEYEEKEWPSPTIAELSHQIGVSEELILESLEYGVLEPVSLLQ